MAVTQVKILSRNHRVNATSDPKEYALYGGYKLADQIAVHVQTEENITSMYGQEFDILGGGLDENCDSKVEIHVKMAK